MLRIDRRTFLGRCAAAIVSKSRRLSADDTLPPYLFDLQAEILHETGGIPDLYQTHSEAFGKEQEEHYTKLKNAIDKRDPLVLNALLLQEWAQNPAHDADKAVIAKAMAYTLTIEGEDFSKASMMQTFFTAPVVHTIQFITRQKNSATPQIVKDLPKLVSDGYTIENPVESRGFIIMPHKELGAFLQYGAPISAAFNARSI